MEIKPLDIATDRWSRNTERAADEWLRNSLQAYLEGQDGTSWNWVMGVIRSTDAATAREAFDELQRMGYGDPARRKKLSDWFQRQ